MAPLDSIDLRSYRACASGRSQRRILRSSVDKSTTPLMLILISYLSQAEQSKDRTNHGTGREGPRIPEFRCSIVENKTGSGTHCTEPPPSLVDMIEMFHMDCLFFDLSPSTFLLSPTLPVIPGFLLQDDVSVPWFCLGKGSEHTICLAIQ